MNNKLIILPQMKIMFHVKHYFSDDIFVIAGGRKPEIAWLKNVAKDKMIHCADRGAEYCFAADLHCISITGDGDSARKSTYEIAKKNGAIINMHPIAKDDTDLQLLLKTLQNVNIIVSGVWGGRFDHLYSNIYSLLQHKYKKECQIILADDKEVMLLLTDNEAVNIELSDVNNLEAISVLSLTSTSKVNFTGVHWPLNNTELQQLYPYSISNLLLPETSNCFCKCLSGSIGLYFKWK